MEQLSISSSSIGGIPAEILTHIALFSDFHTIYSLIATCSYFREVLNTKFFFHSYIKLRLSSYSPEECSQFLNYLGKPDALSLSALKPLAQLTAIDHSRDQLFAGRRLPSLKRSPPERKIDVHQVGPLLRLSLLNHPILRDLPLTPIWGLMGCSTYVEFSKIDNAILGIPFGGSTTDWIVSRYLLTLRLLSHPIEPVELRVDAETEADGQLLLLQEGWKRLYKSITACNGIWGTETPFPESMHVLAYSMAAQWTSLLLIKLFRMLQSRLSRAGYVDATSAGLSPEHSQLPSNLILPPSIDTIPLAQIYADPENDKSALLSDCFGSFEASYRFAVSHLKTMATKQFMEDDWVGYYSCCNAQDTPWDMTFDGPMQGIKFSTSSSPPNHRHDMTLRSNGYDVVGAFQLFGSLNTNTGYFHLIKRYEAQPVVWNWEGRLTPWGLVGVWGRHAPSQWGGLFWLWKSSWSRPAPPGMVLEKGRGGTENLAGQISIMMFQAVSREETEVGLMWNP